MTSTPASRIASDRDPAPPEILNLLKYERDTFEMVPEARALLDAMPTPAMVLDSARRVVLVNRGLRTALDAADLDLATGVTPGDVLGCRNAATARWACGHTEGCDVCGAHRAIRECMHTRSAASHECRIRSLRPAQGGSLDFRASVSPLEICGAPFFIVALEDISSEKRRRVLERTFLHDLLNTCGGVAGLAELLTDPENDAATDAELKVDIRKLSTRVIEQIASHRQLLAAENGEMALKVEPVELEAFLRETVALYRHHEVASGRELRVLSGVPGVVRTDRALLGRAVGNLVKNALEATRPGGTVVVGSRRAGADALVSVHNPGVMPREVQLQVFQRSFSTKGGEGRGLGTYGARLFVVNYLHGEIAFRSIEGAGTTFEITLPCAWPEVAAG